MMQSLQREQDGIVDQLRALDDVGALEELADAQKSVSDIGADVPLVLGTMAGRAPHQRAERPDAGGVGRPRRVRILSDSRRDRAERRVYAEKLRPLIDRTTVEVRGVPRRLASMHSYA